LYHKLRQKADGGPAQAARMRRAGSHMTIRLSRQKPNLVGESSVDGRHSAERQRGSVDPGICRIGLPIDQSGVSLKAPRLGRHANRA
jgi:hypothetical protein